MTDPKNFYKKKPVVDFLGSVRPEPESTIPDASSKRTSFTVSATSCSEGFTSSQCSTIPAAFVPNLK